MGSSHGQQTIQGACVSETAIHDHGRRLDQREFQPMAEVPFRPVCQLSEYKGKGASASREQFLQLAASLSITLLPEYNLLIHNQVVCSNLLAFPNCLLVPIILCTQVERENVEESFHLGKQHFTETSLNPLSPMMKMRILLTVRLTFHIELFSCSKENLSEISKHTILGDCFLYSHHLNVLNKQ